MIFTNRETLEDRVVRLLAHKKLTVGQMAGLIASEHTEVSLQAIYKAIRFLVKEGVLVKTQHQFSLSNEWTSKIKTISRTVKAFPTLDNHESIVYSFTSMHNLDIYWKHLLEALYAQFPENFVYLYCPYNIWYHLSGRTESETEFYTAFTTQKRFGCYVIGNSTPYDQEFKRVFQSTFLQIDARPKASLKNTEYLTIVGDFVVRTILGHTLTKAIMHHYPNYHTSLASKIALDEVMTKPTKCKIKIEHDREKAALLKKKLGKNLYMAKGLK